MYTLLFVMESGMTFSVEITEIPENLRGLRPIGVETDEILECFVFEGRILRHEIFD